jgi:hypothetical protein
MQQFSPEWLMIFYIANQVLSALIQSMPPPNGNAFYNFIYKFLSLLIADFKSFSLTAPPKAGVQQFVVPASTTTVTPGNIVSTLIKNDSSSSSNIGVL